MKRMLALALLALLTLPLLTACGSDEGDGVEINVYNWGEYIDESVLDDFTAETGIRVNYTTFQTNEEMYAKIKGGGSSYDVIIPSDYMISRMIAEDMLEPLDFDNIPNFSDVREDLLNPEYDPDGLYSVPYTWGTVGIIYDTTQVETPDSWSILWDEEYEGQIVMFNNSRDALGIALKLLGYSFNTTDEGQLREAADLLREQKDVVQTYLMDEIFDKLESGEALIGPYYAGDYLTMKEVNPDLGFAIPKEGTNRFVDAMCIPKGSKYKEEAEAFINFMCSTDAALQNIEYIGYSTPLNSVYEQLDDEVKNDGVSYPDDELLSQCESFQNLPQETLDLYDELWIEIFK